jgi:hypothetical protein
MYNTINESIKLKHKKEIEKYVDDYMKKKLKGTYKLEKVTLDYFKDNRCELLCDMIQNNRISLKNKLLIKMIYQDDKIDKCILISKEITKINEIY